MVRRVRSGDRKDQLDHVQMPFRGLRRGDEGRIHGTEEGVEAVGERVEARGDVRSGNLRSGDNRQRNLHGDEV